MHRLSSAGCEGPACYLETLGSEPNLDDRAMNRLWILFGVLTSACFYVDRVTIVLGCSDLLVFPGEINNSLSLALDGDCDHTCIVVNAQMNYQWTLDMGTDYFIHHVLVYLGAQENTSQVPLLLDVGTECCDMANFSKDCYVTFQPTWRNNSLSYNCQSSNVSHARYLRLIRQAASPVEICEVQIFGCLSLARGETNEALFKNTTQISTSRGGPAWLAVDNNTDGKYSHGSCSHTNELSGAQFWWQVDLSLALPVAKLTIYNRIDCCANRLKNIEVLVGRSKTSAGSNIAFTRCVQHDDEFPTVQTLVCGQPVCGQYVRVVKAPANVTEALTLCEVRVYTGTFDPGKPKTNELSVQTSSTPPTTPENVTTPENSVVNTAGSTQTQNIRETTPDETSEDNSLSPLVDITTPGGVSADAGGETNAAPFPFRLDSISSVKNPQPSANDSSTQPSAENSTTTATGDETRLTWAETTMPTSHSDNETQTFTSGLEFTEVTRTHPELPTDGTTTTMADLVSSVSFFIEFADQATAAVSTTTARFYSTATTTGNEESLPNIDTSAAMTDMRVSVAVVVADLQRSVLGNVTIMSKLPSDMAATDLDTLTATAAPRPDVLVTCHEGVSCLESATRELELIVTNRDHFSSAPIIATASPPTNLEHLVTKSLSNMKLVSSDTMLTANPMTRLEHFVTDLVITNIPVISQEHFVTESVSDHESVPTNSVLNANHVTNLEPVVTESVPPVSPVTFDESLKLDSVINAIPVSKMDTESLPITPELTNLALVTNYFATATTTTTSTTAQVDVVNSMPEKTRGSKRRQVLAVVATSTSSSPTTAQDFLSAVSALTCDFQFTPSDFLVTVVSLSTDVLMSHFDSLAQGLHQTSHFFIFTSPYFSEATNSGGDAIVDIIVSTVHQGVNVVSSNDEYSYPASAFMVDFSHVTSTALLPSSAEAEEVNGDRSVDLFSEQVKAAPRSFVSTIEGQNHVTSPAVADATKVTASDHGENAIRDVANSKDVFWSITPSASQVVDSNSSGSDNTELSYPSWDMSTDLSSLATSDVSSVSVKRSKEDRTLFVSDSSFVVSPTTHVTGKVDSISLLPLPSASQVPHLWSSSEEYSQLSLSNQTAVLLETITKLIPVLVESDESRAGLIEANAMPTATSSIIKTTVVNNMPATSTQSSDGGNNHRLLSTSTVVTTSEHVTTADVSDAVEVTRMGSSLDEDSHYLLLHPAPVMYLPETFADHRHDPDSVQVLSQTPTLGQVSLSTTSNKNESPSSKEQQVTAGSITWTSTRSTTSRPSSTPPRSTLCPCGCQRRSLQMNTSEGADYLEQLRQVIEDELKVPRADLAQQVMKKTSAPDRRASAVVFGAVAVATMVLAPLVFVLPDLIGLLRWLHMCVVRRTRVVKRHLPA